MPCTVHTPGCCSCRARESWFFGDARARRWPTSRGCARPCVCAGERKGGWGHWLLAELFPFLSLHPVVGDGSLKRGARDHLRVCVFVGFLCVNNFSFAVFAVSPLTWSHCEYFSYRLQQMMMLVIALSLHKYVDLELEGGRNRLWSIHVRRACRETLGVDFSAYYLSLPH